MANGVRYMTFNSALSDRRTEAGQLKEILATGDYELARNDAAIIQHLRPDVLLLQEFDYDADRQGLDDDSAIDRFQKNYLGVSQDVQGFQLDPIEYPYVYVPEVNTGLLSTVDVDKNGEISLPGDGYGFGNFDGQYGMVLLSQYPIKRKQIRTFQEFLWKDMPGSYANTNYGAESTEDLRDFYSDSDFEDLRLSSKNHIDVPIKVDGKKVHILASHPTPPVFDGDEKRNLKRNNDEIRFWADYISSDVERNSYIIDDNGVEGGLHKKGRKSFVIMGDQNADPVDGDSDRNSAFDLDGNPTNRGAINQLLGKRRVNTYVVPFSAGGVEAAYSSFDPLINTSNPSRFNELGNPGEDTSLFGLRVDYALPSRHQPIFSSGVFNPDSSDPEHVFLPSGSFETDQANGGFDYRTSDHRAVYVDLGHKGDRIDSFKLNLFHQSDQEGFSAAPGDALLNSAVLNRLRSSNDDPSIFINSGDLWIAGIYSEASSALFGGYGLGPVMLNNHLNWQAITWGNHEFDFRSDVVATALRADSNRHIGLNNVIGPVEDESTEAYGRADVSVEVEEPSEENPDGSRVLRIHASVNELSSALLSDETAIQLVNIADRNDVVSNLDAGASSDGRSAYVTGEVELTSDQLTALMNGSLAMIVRTDDSPEGEAIAPVAVTHTYPGTHAPYMSANMDFAEDPFLGPLQLTKGRKYVNRRPNSTTNAPMFIQAGGEIIGVVAATTPTMPSLASNSVGNGGVVTPENWSSNQQGYDDLAALIQAQVDDALLGPDGEQGTNDDVNKVVVATHMQKINIDVEELVPRLEGVDVYVAGGSNTVFQNPENPLYPGGSAGYDAYPLLLEAGDGKPVALVNTDMNHRYLGYLQLEFDQDGVISNDFNADGEFNFNSDADFNTDVSMAYPAIVDVVAALNAENLYDPRVANLAAAMGGQMSDKESRWYGKTEHYMNGNRLGGGLDGVRTQETNLSNVIHDSYVWYAQMWDPSVVISMSNGSGIRDAIGQILPDESRRNSEANPGVGKPEGGITQADVEAALAFNNSLSLIDVTGSELKTTLEKLTRLGTSDGDDGAYQIGGFAYSWDPSQSEGERVRNLRLLDENGDPGDFVVQDGVVVSDATYRMATLGYNASRIFDHVTNQNRVNLDSIDPENSTGGIIADLPDDLINNAADFRPGTQQDAFAEYLYEFSRMGTDDTSDDVFVGHADTPRELDERIQILSYRDDSLAEIV